MPVIPKSSLAIDQHRVEPSTLTRHHSGVQAVVIDDEEDAILALGREHLEGVKELRQRLAHQQTVAEDLVFEVQRLRRRIAQLEAQLAER